MVAAAVPGSVNGLQKELSQEDDHLVRLTGHASTLCSTNVSVAI